MPLPVRIAAILKKHGKFEDHPCQGAKFHSPRPLITSTVLMPDKRKINLCGTCRGNLGVYVFLHNSENGLDWPTKREFGNEIRAIGDQIVKVGRK